MSVFGIGSVYVVAPERVLLSFGLKPPAADVDTRAWLRLKGIRDVASGLVVLTLMLMAERRLLGVILLVYAVIPFGDMLIVLGSGGSRARAYSTYGVTCAVMVAAGLLLMRVV